MFYNKRNAHFQGDVQIDTSITKPSVIYASKKFFYPNGYTLLVQDDKGEIIPAADYKVTDIKENYIGVQVTNTKWNGKVLSILLAPKSSEEVEFTQ